MADERYEINHDGEIVVGDSALCNDQSKMLKDLFSQYGWSCTEENKEGACRRLRLTHPGNESKMINVYSGTIRNEARNPYEKKIQLGTASDPKTKSKEDTIILGIYVYNANDTFKDAIFVGYPIDDSIRYDTNPSIRGTFVNKLLIQAKTKGFVYDEEHNSVGFRAEFIFYYLENHYDIHYNKKVIPKMDDDIEYDVPQEDTGSSIVGANILFYGVPGAGKSYEIDQMIVQERSERVVFHPDYTYSDFVGQILPRIIKKEGESEGKLRYVFEPGPFTKMLKKAHEDPDNMYYLVIEEINRGNAPAIFGDIFQLLDRNDDGSGKYHISNYDMAKVVYGDEHEDEIIKMPANLTLLATMNTSDQNVFTLDTAFQRRWEMHLIKNDVYKADHADEKIGGSEISWGRFADVTNMEIIRFGEETGSSEDKRLGAYFAKFGELSKDKFPEKVLKYLWDDAFKMDHYTYFNESISSVDGIIDVFRESQSEVDVLKRVLKLTVYQKMLGQAVAPGNTEEVVEAEEGTDDE